MASADIKYPKPKAHLPRLHENPYDTVVEASDSINDDVEAFKSRGEKTKKALRAAAALLAVVGAVVVSESKTTANFINDTLNRTGNAITPPAVPTAEDATTIRIGDMVSYKSNDGKEHITQIRNLSDISAIATSINPDLNSGTFDAMLESENHNSSLVHFGDEFTVNKDLDIRDIGPRP
jgi:hypothetical protein